jgi:DNA-nicking Smr family endonuclease
MSVKAKPSRKGTLHQLAELVNKAGLQLKQQDKIISSKSDIREALRPDEKASITVSESSDEELFAEAMAGVQRSSWRHTPYPSTQPEISIPSDPDLEAKRLMQEAVDGDSSPPILDHPEYIEGWVDTVGKRFLSNLRSGLYSIQGQLDLHGFNRADAEIAVEEYIVRMSRFRPCCVKIIHGRGINSPTDRATLKESLQRLLSTRRMSRYVVAYASAPQNDGGVGAVYVLLRRK